MLPHNSGITMYLNAAHSSPKIPTKNHMKNTHAITGGSSKTGNTIAKLGAVMLALTITAGLSFHAGHLHGHKEADEAFRSQAGQTDLVIMKAEKQTWQIKALELELEKERAIAAARRVGAPDTLSRQTAQQPQP